MQSKTLGLRPTAETLQRIDALADVLAKRAGVPVRRGTVAMQALLTGLAAMEKREQKAKEDGHGK